MEEITLQGGMEETSTPRDGKNGVRYRLIPPLAAAATT